MFGKHYPNGKLLLGSSAIVAVQDPHDLEVFHENKICSLREEFGYN